MIEVAQIVVATDTGETYEEIATQTEETGEYEESVMTSLEKPSLEDPVVAMEACRQTQRNW